MMYDSDIRFPFKRGPDVSETHRPFGFVAVVRIDSGVGDRELAIAAMTVNGEIGVDASGLGFHGFVYPAAMSASAIA